MTLFAHVLAHKACRPSLMRGYLHEEPECRHCFWEQYFVVEWTRRELSFRLDWGAKLELEWYINMHEGVYPASWEDWWFVMNRFERDFYCRFFHKYFDPEDWSWECWNVSACAITTLRELDRAYVRGDGPDD